MDLKRERKKKGLTQQQLASLINKDRTLISKIESGDSSPSVEVAKKIAAVLGFDWTLFFPDEGKATSKKAV
ncbi:MAG: helix-turn-helix transcriptional regulator [Peptococcaceae bacterium]|jgi:transcriptional regulator with XRE-family HTH domain|nr:helix-turn-helix transcriptional regulator [Peptococcaceae bacterium]MDH7525253.1 helix-turn-helix transcriptional regulator [Peptococcaceae bacterium]